MSPFDQLRDVTLIIAGRLGGKSIVTRFSLSPHNQGRARATLITSLWHKFITASYTIPQLTPWMGNLMRWTFRTILSLFSNINRLLT